MKNEGVKGEKHRKSIGRIWDIGCRRCFCSGNFPAWCQVLQCWSRWTSRRIKSWKQMPATPEIRTTRAIADANDLRRQTWRAGSHGPFLWVIFLATKTSIHWGFSSQPCLMTPEGTDPWDVSLKVMVTLRKNWITAKKRHRNILEVGVDPT